MHRNRYTTTLGTTRSARTESDDADFVIVAVVGTDCRWNAEYNLQVRAYGQNRTHGCELNATRYDLVATALGGHGELVTAADELAPAIERSLASGEPAVVNVMIESVPSPVVRRT